MNSAKNELSTEEILSIIRTCNESNVEEFNFKTLKLKFHPHRNEGAVSLGQGADQDVKNPKVSEDLTYKAELMDQTAQFEAEEAQLLIDDPMSFEKSQIDRHIERNRDGSQVHRP